MTVSKSGGGEALSGSEVVRQHLTRLAETATASRELDERAGQVAELAIITLEGGGTLYFCGNGGSAADAQHLAAEYVVRFLRRRPALAAVALTVDTSVLTAGGNDFGFEHVFERQIEALARPGDLLFLHSTSGNSDNLVLAARAARARGVQTVALLARDGGRLRHEVDHVLLVPTDVTAHAQEVHLALGHAICETVDRHFAAQFGDEAGDEASDDAGDKASNEAVGSPKTSPESEAS